jgi:signal transduction histidine kinase
MAVIRIADNGIGIPERLKQRLFEPLFTTKPIGKGTGLGLSIAHQIVVKKHNGTMEVNSQPGIGTEFAIAIPI